MDNFKAVYKILSTLEAAMDLPEFDVKQIDAEHLNLNDPPKNGASFNRTRGKDSHKGLCIRFLWTVK